MSGDPDRGTAGTDRTSARDIPLPRPTSDGRSPPVACHPIPQELPVIARLGRRRAPAAQRTPRYLRTARVAAVVLAGAGALVAAGPAAAHIATITAHGWIAADTTSLTTTPWRVVVSRAARRVSVVDAGRVVARFGAVIGARATPTPSGLFSVVAIVPQVDARGFIGPFALHLSAHSDVLDNYGGGSGRVGLRSTAAAARACAILSARRARTGASGSATRRSPTLPCTSHGARP